MIAPVTLPVVVPTETCPETAVNVSPDRGGLDESTRLEPTLGQVLAYGTGPAVEEFGGYGLVWHDADDASVFAAFTGHLDEHRAALAGLVESPDELIVCQAALSDADTRALYARLVAELEGRFTSVGITQGHVSIELPANEELLAGELVDRYGGAVVIRVGALAYPLDRATSVCQPAPPDRSIPGLAITVTDVPHPLLDGGGEPVELIVTLTNHSDQRIAFASGTATGQLLDRDGRVVNAITFGIGAVAIPVDLESGASTELTLLVDTASCDPAHGYTLPSGDYRLVALVSADGDILNSDPVAITIGT